MIAVGAASASLGWFMALSKGAGLAAARAAMERTERVAMNFIVKLVREASRGGLFVRRCLEKLICRWLSEWLVQESLRESQVSGR